LGTHYSPVFPLDGGRVAHNILIQYDPSMALAIAAFRYNGGLMALVGLIFFHIYMAFLFGLLAFKVIKQ
jgi:Zn-dependent protease